MINISCHSNQSSISTGIKNTIHVEANVLSMYAKFLLHLFNVKEIKTNSKMCTGADVSLAQYFNKKLNTDDRCHWG